MLSSKTKRELKIDQRQILIDSIEIGIPSPQQILTWGERLLPNGKKVGVIKNSKTVNYKRFTPFRDGLFCERIFGPVTSFVCACGKKQPHSKIAFCEKCEVEYIDQRSRRYRLGYISLLSPVTHVWYLKGRPSYLSLFLGKRKKTIVALAYCNAYLIEHGVFKKSDNVKSSDVSRKSNAVELKGYDIPLRPLRGNRRCHKASYKARFFKGCKEKNIGTNQTLADKRRLSMCLLRGFSRQPERNGINQNRDLSSSTSYATYLYARQHTLPFLPTLVSHFYLRDALLSYLYSVPAYHDLPLMEYCYTKRWEPLRDVHKFMAHKTVDNLKHDVSSARTGNRSLQSSARSDALPVLLCKGDGQMQRHGKQLKEEGLYLSKDYIEDISYKSQSLFANNCPKKICKPYGLQIGLQIGDLTPRTGLQIEDLIPRTGLQIFDLLAKQNLHISDLLPRAHARASSAIVPKRFARAWSTKDGFVSKARSGLTKEGTGYKYKSVIFPNKSYKRAPFTKGNGLQIFARSVPLTSASAIVPKRFARRFVTGKALICQGSPKKQLPLVPQSVSAFSYKNFDFSKKAFFSLQDLRLLQNGFCKANRRPPYNHMKGALARLCKKICTKQEGNPNSLKTVVREISSFEGLRGYKTDVTQNKSGSFIEQTKRFKCVHASFPKGLQIFDLLRDEGEKGLQIEDLLGDGDWRKEGYVVQSHPLSTVGTGVAPVPYPPIPVTVGDAVTNRRFVTASPTVTGRVGKPRQFEWQKNGIERCKHLKNALCTKRHRVKRKPYLPESERKTVEGNNKSLLSGLELTAIREILSYTGGGALQQLLQQFNQHDLCKFLFAEAQILRVLYETLISTGLHSKGVPSLTSYNSSNKTEHCYVTNQWPNRSSCRCKSYCKKICTCNCNPSSLCPCPNSCPKKICLGTGIKSKVCKPLVRGKEVMGTGIVVPFARSFAPVTLHDKGVPFPAGDGLQVQKNLLGMAQEFCKRPNGLKRGAKQSNNNSKICTCNPFFQAQSFLSVHLSRSKKDLEGCTDKEVVLRKQNDNRFTCKVDNAQLCKNAISSQTQLNKPLTSVFGFDPAVVQSKATPKSGKDVYDHFQNKTPDLQKKQIVRLSRRIYKVARRLKITQLLTRNHRKPEWMILSHLPVLPPDLRPILQMSEKVIVASDLNVMYQRVIYRNNRHLRVRFIDFHLVTAIQRLVQDAVDRLIENGKGGSKPYYTQGGRPLKSLSDILKGKKGRFRLNLLGKRVDFSGRSVIVVSPLCQIHECGLPKAIALELYHYFLLRQLIVKKHCASIVTAKKMIKSKSSLMWEILRELMYHHPVLLNRAPTLHRLGIQAFQPRLVLGSAILLHPLVCSGFNADFDGDQMGVHLPLSFAARAESWDLLWSRNNLLSPATGQPMLVPSQDMVLGFYYITAQAVQNKALPVGEGFARARARARAQRAGAGAGITNRSPSGVRFDGVKPSFVKDAKQSQKASLFLDLKDITTSFQTGKIKLHQPVWLYWNGKIENEEGFQKPIELRVHGFGAQQSVYERYIASNFFTKARAKSQNDFYRQELPRFVPSYNSNKLQASICRKSCTGISSNSNKLFPTPAPVFTPQDCIQRFSSNRTENNTFFIYAKLEAYYLRTTAGRVLMNNLIKD